MKQQAKGSAEEVYNYTLQNAYKRLAEAAISDQDKETVSKYVSHLACMGVSKGRLAKILFHLKVFAEHLGCGICNAKRLDMERFVIWLKGAGYAPNTESDYIIAVKRFYKFVRYDNVDLEMPFSCFGCVHFK
ncbi:MAG: hypothetical protein KGI02_05020 [Thaumarchaeota archaeon]|nr:hypothetical protein [Nitrososphaerota archaeon]